VAEYQHNCPTGLPSIEGSDFKLIKRLSQRKYHSVYMSFQESTRQMRVVRFLTRPSFVVREVRVAARMCVAACESAHYNLPVATVKKGHWEYEGSHFTTLGEGMVYPHLGSHKPMADALAPLRASGTGALPPQLMHLVTKQLLQTVSCMHAQGVMHRDLKQSNILATVEPSLVLTIIDFGSAEMVKPAVDHSVLVGTMQYKPPELLLGLTRYDHFIDMWELGVTFANLLFDSPPRDALFNPRIMVESSRLVNMDDMVMRRRRALGQTKQKHVNMLEQISLFRGNDCVTANVEKYRPHLSPHLTKAFKRDYSSPGGFVGVNALIKKLETNEIEGVEKFRQDAAKRFAALGDPVAIKLVGSMLVCDPELRPSAYDSLQNLDKFLKEEADGQSSSS